MKTSTLVAVFIITLSVSFKGTAQTYTVTSNNQSWASLVPGGTCNNCTINVPAGWTLLLNSNGTCKACSFNGGTVNISSNFDFSNGSTTFTNDTVLINKSTSFNNVSFSNDSVAVNFPLSSSNSTTTVDHTRMQMNANVTFNSATFTNDSIHVAGTTLKINNGTTAFTSTFIEVNGNSGALSLNAASFTTSNVTLSDKANLTTSNAFTSDGSSFSMQANTTLKGSSITTTGTTINASGGTITSDNALKMTSTTLTSTAAISIKAGTVTLQTGSAITLASGSNFKSDNAISITNSSFSADGSTIKAGSFTAQTNSSVTISGASSLKSDNAITFTGSDLTTSGSTTVTAGSFKAQSSSNVNMSGTSNLTTDNSIDIDDSRMNLTGNAWTNAKGALIFEGGSVVVVGDGTSASTAHLMTNNALQVLDGSQFGIAGGNNYLFTSSNTYTDGSHSYTIKTNSVSCGSGHPNACSSGFVYGCATLNNGGAVGCVLLALSAPELTARLSNGQVSLSWQIKAGSNADRFLIQRSANGNDWTLISEVPVNEFSSNYNLQDAQVQPGTNYYRVQVVDRDGNSAFSKITSVTLDAVLGQTAVFPNPIKGKYFFLKTPTTDAVILKVFTVSGQPVLLSPLKGQTQYSVQLPGSLVTNTCLIVQVIGNGRTQTFTVLAQ